MADFCNKTSTPPDNNCPGEERPLLDGQRPVSEQQNLISVLPIVGGNLRSNVTTDSQPIFDNNRPPDFQPQTIPTHGDRGQGFQRALNPFGALPLLSGQRFLSIGASSEQGASAEEIAALQQASFAEEASLYGGPSNTLEIAPQAASNVLELPQVYQPELASASLDTGTAGESAAYSSASAAAGILGIIGVVVGTVELLIAIASNPSEWNPFDPNSQWYVISIPGLPSVNPTSEIVNGLKSLFQGVPKLQKSREVQSALGGVLNPALQGYYQAVTAALRAHVPLSVSSGPWRARLDRAAGDAIRALEHEGYPPDLARQLFLNLIDHRISQIPGSFGQWLLKHPHYKPKVHHVQHARNPVTRSNRAARPVRGGHKGHRG